MTKKKPMNTTIDDNLRMELRVLAEANQMTVSALLRWLGARAVDSPTAFGLLGHQKKNEINNGITNE